MGLLHVLNKVAGEMVASSATSLGSIISCLFSTAERFMLLTVRSLEKKNGRYVGSKTYEKINYVNAVISEGPRGSSEIRLLSEVSSNELTTTFLEHLLQNWTISSHCGPWQEK